MWCTRRLGLVAVSEAELRTRDFPLRCLGRIVGRLHIFGVPSAVHYAALLIDGELQLRHHRELRPARNIIQCRAVSGIVRLHRGDVSLMHKSQRRESENVLRLALLHGDALQQ